MQLRAPLLYTMTGSVLKDCAVGIAGDRISYVVPIADAPHDSDIIDLPHTTLLPGFVNAHCHLDLSHLRGKVPYTHSFTEWIQKIVTLRKHQGGVEIQAAAQELINSGVTSVMDHVGADLALANLMANPLRKWMFLEVIGFTPEQAAAALITQRRRALEAHRLGAFATPSPHAPYSLDPEVFEQIIQSSCRTRSGIQSEDQSGSRLKAGMTNLLSIHCAEGAEEWEMFTEGKGKLWELVKSLATPPLRIRGGRGELPSEPHSNNPSQPPLILRGGEYDSPIHYLSKHNLLPRAPWMAVHCNTLTDEDIILLKQSHATVVHCPRSHHFFNHPPFPLEKLRAAGVPVAIGTDSLASCPNFDFLEELRAMREEFSFLSTEEILRMATACHPGLRAGVHRETQSGCRIKSGMTDGAFADIIGLPQQNDILQGPVTFSMIGGRRVI